MVSQEIQDARVVVVESNRIERICDEDNLDQYKLQQIVDLKGHYLLPGLIDSSKFSFP
jgi:imidazolonepropionase-like amidohydrolase